MYVFLKAQEAHMFLREWLSENVSVGVAVETRIIYGGELSNGVFDCCCHTCPTLTSALSLIAILIPLALVSV